MMLNQDVCKRRHTGMPFWLIVIWTVLLVFMARGFPFTGDDFNRVRVGSPAFADLFRYSRDLWNNTNGRVLGNLFSFLFVDYPWVLAAVRGGTISILTVLLVKVSKVCSRVGWGVSMAGVLFLPPMIFREVYPWNAGFFNYVPPVVLIVLAAWMFRMHMESKAHKVTWQVIILFALVGGATTLFMENITVFSMIAGSSVFFWSWYRKNKLMSQSGAYVTGVLFGSILMFMSPVYRTVHDGADGYRSYAESFSDLLYQIAGNYRMISIHLLHNNALLITAACLTVLVLICLLPKTHYTYIMKAMVVCSSGYFLLAGYFPDSLGLLSLARPLSIKALAVDQLMLMFLMIPVAWSLWQDQNGWGIVFLFSALLIAAPLLMVSPIGPRNTFAIHILILAAILTMLRSIENKGTWNHNTAGTAILIAVLMIAGTYGYMFFRIGQTQTIQYLHIRQQMESGAHIIELPRYPYSHLVYGPHGKKIGNLFFYQARFDIEFIFIPYEDWYAVWGDQ